MKHAKHTLLSEEGSFEKIVNSRVAARERKAKARYILRLLLRVKPLWAMFLLAVVELFNLLIWAFGGIDTVPSVMVSEVITCAMSFLAGRVFGRVR